MTTSKYMNTGLLVKCDCMSKPGLDFKIHHHYPRWRRRRMGKVIIQSQHAALPIPNEMLDDGTWEDVAASNSWLEAVAVVRRWCKDHARSYPQHWGID